MKKIIILFLLFSTMTTYKIFACDCASYTFTNEVKRSHYIVAGEVISKKLIGSSKIGPYYQYEVKVSYYFKGVAMQKTVKLRSGMGGKDCGYVFEVGKSYLIYGQAMSKKGIITTNSCFRTKPLADNKDLEKLNSMLTKRTPK